MDFQYRAKAHGGDIFRGSRSAESENELVKWIRNQGWVPIEITKVTNAGSRNSAKSEKSFDWEDFFLFPHV